MFKHIIGQACFQTILLIMLVFFGENMLLEFPDGFDNMDGFQRYQKYSDSGFARSGRLIKINGDHDYEDIMNDLGIYSRHMTFVFNTFVMLQVFNFINSRKIHD